MDFDPSTAKPTDTSVGAFDPSSAAPVRPTETETPQPSLRKGRTAGEVAKDTAIGVTQGTGYLLGGMAELANLATGGLLDKGVRKAQGVADRALGGEGNDGPGITGAYTRAYDELNAAKSPTLQRKQADLAQTDGFVASAKKVLTDPTLAGQFVAEQVPNLALLGAGSTPTLARGVAAAEARGLTGKAAEEAGRHYLERQIIASEAAQEAGPSAQQARQQIEALPQQVWDANPEYARRVANGEAPDEVKASMETWAAAEAAAIGGVAGAVGGRITAPLEARIFTRGIDESGDSLLRSTGKAIAREASEEAIQEGGNQFGSNVGVHSVDPTQDLTEGVGQNAGIGAALGGLLGGGLNVAGAATARAPEQRGEGATLTRPAPPSAEDRLRTAVDAARTPQERAAAQQALAGYLEANGRLIGSDAVTVDARGNATTAGQADALARTREAQGLSPDVQQAQLRHPGYTAAPVPFPGAAPGSLSDVANTLASAQQPAAAEPALQVPPNIDPATGQPTPWTREQIVSYLAAQLEVGKTPSLLPKGATIAKAFGLKPREAAEIRREAIAQSKAGATTPATTEAALQEPADVDAARRPEPVRNEDVADLDVGDRGAPGADVAEPGAAPGSLADAAATTHAVAPEAALDAAQAAADAEQTPAADAAEVAPAQADAAPAEPAPAAAPPADAAAASEAITAAAHEAATSPENALPQPTEAQKEAGNYKKGHVRVAGLDISIENPAGSQRRPEWPALVHHYGYIKGTIGKDKDHVDVFLTEHAADTSRPVFVVDQRNEKGGFDEHKVVLGAENVADARKAYLANYGEGWSGAGAITQMSHDEFEAWVRDPTKTTKPAAASVSNEAGPPSDLVAVKNLYGDTVRVRQSDLDSDRVQLPLYAKNGLRKTIKGARTIHRDNIDLDGSKQAAMNAQHQPGLISRPGAKSERDMGFTSEAAARRAVAKAGLSQDDYEIQRVPSGHVAVRKKAVAEAPPAPRAPESTESKQARIQAAFAANRQAIKDMRLKKGDAVTWTENGQTVTGTILNLGDKEQAVVAVGRPGRNGGVRDSHVGAAQLTKVGEEAPAATKADLEVPAEPVQPETSENALHTALTKVSDWVAGELQAGREISAKALFDRANAEVGGSQADGAYSPRDAYDALELGVNKAIKAGTFGNVGGVLPHEAATALAGLRKLLNRLPTQSKRTKEQDEFQQFSTPPTLAFLAARAANLTPADTVLEPSAGTGDLVVMAQAAGAKVVANELAPRRAALLRELGVDRVFTENAEQLDNILPDDVRPSVVLMNPPFSASAGRMGQGFRRTAIGAQHVEQALQRLAPGGRLVAIVGEGMAADRPAFRDWWEKIRGEYAVRANIGLSGKGYAKYGTTFDNQLLVIDKTGPTTSEPITGKFESAEDALATIEAIRNEAPDRAAPGNDEVAQRAAAEPARDEAAGEGGSDAGRQQPVPPAARGARTGKRGGRELSGAAPDAGRAAPDGGDGSGAGVPAADEQRGRGQPDAAVRGGEGTGEGGAVPAGDAGGVAIEAAPEVARAAGKITKSIFEQYQPQRLRIAGAKPHPGALVQSAAMAAVEPPAPTYTPNLAKEVVTGGKLSLAQLESVVYAGQAHEQILPNGDRRGFFVGDGTGVGKGREISGILLDNIRQGRDRAVWVSEKPGLLADAKRDFSGVGGDVAMLMPQSKVKKDAAIDAKRGVMFTTYATLRQGSSIEGKAVKKAGASRVDQLVSWLGPDFDGVVVFDEAHNAGNAVSMKGKRGKTKPSAQALAVVDLQKKLPNARIVYVSATGATEVANLSYATRLGLWGEGTAFPSVEAFINGIHEGGLAAMELVSRDMKAMGVYTARSLSFDGVTYARLEHPLTDFQRDVYNELARAWQGVLRNIDAALEMTSAEKNPNAKAAAKAQFWGAQQRFFNQVLTAMQTPSVLTQIEADLAADEAVVLQIVNTYEAAQTRALAEVENEDDLEALDITPRDGLIQYVQNSFPVAEYEEYVDDNGNRRSRLVTDSAGNPVLNKKAVAMRDKLIETLQQIRVPESPLDMILNHFGADRVAEVTGRKRRVLRRPDPKTGIEKTVVQNRSASAPAAEAAEFQAGKRDILIFSDAGGTGFSFHADRTAKNQKRRQHYLMQAGWRADKAVQGFGRTHRTNEASQPNYRLVTTDLPAQKRFLSSIARRLDQLGALTKGQRDTANQGLFSAKDNLESQYAQDAVTDFLQSLYRGRIPGMEFGEVARELGFDNLIDEQGGGLNVSKLPDVPQFLNRLLSLTVDRQGAVFDQFVQRLESRVDAAIADGSLDTGMQTIDAEKVSKVDEHVLYTDPRSGSETKAVTLELQHKVKLQPFPERATQFVRNANSHKVWAVRELPDRTNREGVIQKVVELAGTGSRRIEEAHVLRSDKFEPMTKDEARQAWKAENEKRPKFDVERRMVLTGTLLPIWDRIKGDVKVVRAQTDDGERLIGRLIPPSAEADTLEAFGVGVEAKSADEVMDAVMKKGETAQLANGWKLKRVRVSGEPRLEVITPQSYLPNVQSEITRLGGFVERIDWAQRLFLPANDSEALGRLLAARPFKTMVGDEEEGNAIRLSRPDPDAAARRGLPLAKLGAEIHSIVSRWGTDAPRVQVVPTAENLPPKVREAKGWETAEGFSDANGVYLVASNLRDMAHAQQVLVHEAIGHYGIEAITGPALWAELGTAVRRMRDSGKHADLFAEIGRRYVGANSEIYTREAIAVMAEKGVRNSIIDRVIAAVARFLRTHLHLDVRFTPAELRQHIVAAARYVRGDARPRVAPQAAPTGAFSQPDLDPNREIPVTVLQGGKFGSVATEDARAKARQRAKEWLASMRARGVTITNEPTGIQIGFSSAGNRELIAWTARPERIDLLAALPGVMRRAVLAEMHGAREGGNAKYATFYAPVQIGGELRVAKLVAREAGNGTFVFDLQASDVLERRSPAEAGLRGGDAPATKAGAPTAMTVAQIRDAVNAVDKEGWGFSRPPGPFYSAMLEALERGEGAPRKADAAAWRGWLDGAQRRGEIRQAERDWLGVDDFIAGNATTTREQLVEFVRANQVQVEDEVRSNRLTSDALPEGWSVEHRPGEDMPYVVLDEEGEEVGFGDTESEALEDAADPSELLDNRPAKYEKYTLPGGSNYHELLLTLPTMTEGEVIDQLDAMPGEPRSITTYSPDVFRTRHFETPNVLAHVRFNERTDVDGKPMLFIEEIQSDWAQHGRRRGFGNHATLDAVAQEVYGKPFAELDEGTQTSVEAEADVRNNGRLFGANGAEEPTAGVPDMPFKQTEDWAMLAFKRMVRWAADNGFDRIGWATGEIQNARYPAGGEQQDKIAHGMESFYDKILPAAVGKWAKRLGGKVDEAVIAGHTNDLATPKGWPELPWHTVHTLAITPAMREAALAGQPLFSRPDPAFAHMAGKVSNFADKFATRSRTEIPGRFDEAQRAAAQKFETFKSGEPLRIRAQRIKANAAKRFTQKVIDQFRPLKTLNMEAFMQAHLSKGTDGALEAAFDHGIPELHQGAFIVRERKGGFRKVMSDLKGEHDQFLMWVVGNRAEALSLEGREHLFTDDDIEAMKRLNLGKMADGSSRVDAYSRALAELNRYNRSFLNIAEQAGLIDAEGRKVWEDGFYIPFYRAMDEDPNAGPGQVKGLLRQRVIERLIGSKEPLGDPLENILANWSQMLTASMRNMAANKALDTAVEQKIASKASGPAKGTVWTMREGAEQHWYVHDPMVLEALESLSFNGYDNPLMRAAGRFKRVLTTGVTINPSFRIRNMARDALSAAATADVGYNPIRNIIEGMRATAPEGDTNVALMAGGGAVRFGSINDGDQASHAKRLIAMGVQDNQILDSADKVKNAMRRVWDWWVEVGDRTETVNRAVVYQRAIEAGRTHLQASFEARDLMNFTSMGSAAAIRALSQVLPFFNARLQGADRLIRGAKADPRRFAAVAGSIAMASALLFLINKDDDDYKALPDYVRDNYWTVKIAGKWLYIPKPFEIGAMGSIVERGTELAVSGDDYQAKDFGATLLSVLSSQLAMNPIPQIVRPVTEAAFNYDLFRMAPIDSMGQQALLPEDRFSPRTSAGAVVAGRVTGISPQRLEHLVTGYFGWLGVQALNASDYLLRDAAGLPSNPRRDLGQASNLFVLGDFVKEPNAGSSKYLTRFYDAQNEIDELYASANQARKTGDLERSADLRADPRLRLRPLYNAAESELDRLNRRIKATSNNRSLSAAQKNAVIDSLNRRRNVIAARVDRISRGIQ